MINDLSSFSSAPEQTDELSLHIRVVGHWTSKLYEYFEAEQKRLEFTMNGETPEVQNDAIKISQVKYRGQVIYCVKSKVLF